jgi:hypothetical protein
VTGYVNTDYTGWTELRVHGVSGTPPESMLQHAEVERVAGDANAGFYRRRFDAESVSSDTAAQRAEAYSWGGLTAGHGQRALWLLLTPFMLVNVAYWALPEAPAPDGGTTIQRLVRRTAEVVQRLFALSITATLMFAVVHVSMDLVGWQCVRPERSCTSNVSWLGFLTWPALASPGRQVVVASVVPLAVVFLLWWLGRATWLRTESSDVPAAEPHDPTAKLAPLEDRRMWNGKEQVRKLRCLHIAAAIAIVAVFLAAPLAGHAWLPRASLAFLAVIAVLACLGTVLDRERPSGSRPVSHRDGFTILPAVAFVLLALAGVAAVVADPRDFSTQASLPWLTGAMEWLLLAQVALLVVMLGLLLMMHRWRPPATVVVPDPESRDGKVVPERPAWYGLAAVVAMTLALVMAGGFAAGLGIRVADTLGKPGPADETTPIFVIPVGYFWVAALTVPLAIGVLVLIGWGWLWLRREAKRVCRDEVVTAYGERLVGDDTERAGEIARTWARAQFSTVGQRLVGASVVVTAVVIGIGLVGFFVDDQWIYDHARWTVNVGSFLVGGLVLAMLWVGRQAYRSPPFRRTVGVMWDIGTFWPRAVHPLAPPCYTERTVPDLITRIRYLGNECLGGHVLLSCHSQGAVIGAAVIMQLTYAESASVALLTYGSPLRRLYSRFFPGYFGVAALLRTGSFLVGPPDSAHGSSEPAGAEPDGFESRRTWPWRNLHRPSDPIGGPVFVTYPAKENRPTAPADVGGGDTDRQLVDPAFAKANGDRSYPSTCGHSNYYADPAFAASLSALRDLRQAHQPPPVPYGVADESVLAGSARGSTTAKATRLG